jgi:hypothetical protein
VQAAAVVHQISSDGHHMSVIALGAVECADIEAGWARRNTRQMHPYIAFWAMRLLAGDGWVTGRGISFYHQPSNACASNHPSFLTSVRSETRQPVEVGSASDPLAEIGQGAEYHAASRHRPRSCNADRRSALGRHRATICDCEFETRPMDWIAVSQSLSSRRWVLSTQKIFHVCGKPKLSGFSDGFGSHRSGRQPFCLCKSLRCPGSPIVIIEIVARQFCHVIVLTVAVAGRCAPSRQHRTSSDRHLPAPHE